MRPRQRCDPGKKFVWDVDILAASIFDGTAEIDGILQNYGIDDQIDAGGTTGRGFSYAGAQLAELVKEDCACKGMTALAFVENNMRPASNLSARAARHR